MACLNCGCPKGFSKRKTVTIARIVNSVLGIYCVNCGNLMYGYCKPMDMPIVIA